MRYVKDPTGTVPKEQGCGDIASGCACSLYSWLGRGPGGGGGGGVKELMFGYRVCLSTLSRTSPSVLGPCLGRQSSNLTLFRTVSETV